MKLRKIGMILTTISGFALSLSTFGVAIPAVALVSASVLGGMGTAMVGLSHKLNPIESSTDK